MGFNLGAKQSTLLLNAVNSSPIEYRLSPAKKRNLEDHKFKDDREVETPNTMATNTRHRLLSTDNRNDRPT